MLVSEQELLMQPPAPEPLPPAPVAPQPEPEPAPAPSPLDGIFAEGDPSAETEPASDTITASQMTDTPGTETASATSSKTSGKGMQAGAAIGASTLGVPGMIAGMVIGDMIEGAMGKQAAAPAPAPEELSDPEAFADLIGPEELGHTPEQLAALGASTTTSSMPAATVDVDAIGGMDDDSPGSPTSDTPSAADPANDAAAAGGASVGGDTTSSDTSSSDNSGSADGSAFYRGGPVTADRLRGPDPAGPDDGSADLDVGEYVVNAQAAQQNLPLLEAINAQGAMRSAPEVITMRWFFESVLPRTPEGRAFAASMDEAGPHIEQALAYREDAPQVMQNILGSYLQPAAEALRRGDYAGALQAYGELGTYAASLAAEGDLGPEIEQLLEEYAETSAEVAHDGELASLATATGNQLIHPGDQVASQPASRLGRIFVGG